MNIDFNGFIDSVNNNLLQVIENDNGESSTFAEFTYTYNSSNYPEMGTYESFGDTESIEYVYE